MTDEHKIVTGRIGGEAHGAYFVYTMRESWPIPKDVLTDFLETLEDYSDPIVDRLVRVWTDGTKVTKIIELEER